MRSVRFVSTVAVVLSLVVSFVSPARSEPNPENEPAFKKLKVQWRTDKTLPGQPVTEFFSFGQDLTDDDLKLFADYPEVRSLQLQGQKIKGSGVKHLAGLKKLERLSLAFTGITDENLKELANLKALKALSLLNTTITDEGIKTLVATFPDLEELWLGQNFEITDDGFKQVVAFKKLRRLHMSNSNVGDKTMEAISGMPELRTLVVGSQVTDAGYAHIAKLPKLEQLQTSFGLTDKGLKALGESKTLREIDISPVKTTLNGVTGMANVSKLTKIHLGFGAEPEAKIKKIKAQYPNCKFESLHIDF